MLTFHALTHPPVKFCCRSVCVLLIQLSRNAEGKGYTIHSDGGKHNQVLSTESQSLHILALQVLPLML